MVMNIRELTSRTGIAERQIRYLIAEGFMPAPHGGRSNADYDDDHVVAIQRYTRLKELGFPPAAIKLLLQGGHGAPFTVAPGITLVVNPDLLGQVADVTPIINRATALLKDLLEEQIHEPDRVSNND